MWKGATLFVFSVWCLERPKQINTKRDPSTPPKSVHWVCKAKVLAMSRWMSSLCLHTIFLFCSMDGPSFCCVVVDGNHDDVGTRARGSIIEFFVRRSLELGRQGRKLIRFPPIGTLFYSKTRNFWKEDVRKFVYIQKTLV
jgi:hypothetical protein